LEQIAFARNGEFPKTVVSPFWRVMAWPVDLSLFDSTRHSPSWASLSRSMARTDGKITDFCIPVNPYFPTAEMFSRFQERLVEVLRYYPSSNKLIAKELAGVLQLPPGQVVVGNGSTELITFLNLTELRESLAIPVPTFSRWTDEPLSLGRAVHLFPTRPEDGFRLDAASFVRFVRTTGARAAVICNPNNPTGGLLPPAELLSLLEQLSDLDVIVVDESFVDFAEESTIPSIAREAAALHNVIILKSLGKNFGLHGLRLGCAIANERLAERLRESLPHWNVNGMAEMLIFELSGHLAEYEAGRRRVVRDRVALATALRQIEELDVFPSHANFVYVRVSDDVDGIELRNRLLVDHGCLVRECGNKVGSSSQFLRIASRPPEEVAHLLPALRWSLAHLKGAGSRLPTVASV
jgi:histidinol-phosphate/aromatic aminotransferase/cobyric acid decarboxylase-like protein